MKVLALTGMPGSGKTTVCKYLLEKTNACWIHLGDFIWNFLKEKKIVPETETEAMAGLYLHTIYKDIPLLKWAIKEIKKCKAEFCLLDSLRCVDEHNFFKKRFKKYWLIAVLADPEIRFERERKRARFGEKITQKKFKLRDKNELLLGVGELIGLADFYIDSNKSLTSVKRQIDKILKQI